MKSTKKHITPILAAIIVITIAQLAVGCGGTGETPSSSKGTQAGADTQAGSGDQEVSTAQTKVMGEGSREFPFTVVDKDGNETRFEIHTDKETVGEALLALELIDGEKSQYGLFVKTVNGITVDYDSDGTYWAFYVNGAYAQKGVDSTAITEGESYTFKVE